MRRPIALLCLALGMLGVLSVASAQTSRKAAPAAPAEPPATLRILCDDDNANAEVFLNGRFKGECPFDTEVPAGSVAVRAVRKVDATRERVFEQQIRVGGGIVKRLEIVLGAPQQTAAAMKAEKDRIARETQERERAEAERERAQAQRHARLLAPMRDLAAQAERGDRNGAWKLSEKLREVAKAQAVEQGGRTDDVVEFERLATQWLEKAANAGQPDAMVALGWDYETGRNGRNQDGYQAAAWYNKAAEAGSPAGMGALGRMYNAGQGVVADPAMARSWWEKGAAANDPTSFYGMGVLYAAGSGGLTRDRATALQWLTRAVDAGSAWGMAELGNYHYNGDGVPRNVDKAAELYAKAAALDLPYGHARLAWAYWNGYGVPQERENGRGLREFLLAVDGGFADAMSDLGYMYEQHTAMPASASCPKPEQLGQYWYQRAAALGQPLATKNAAFNRGKGITACPEESALFRAAMDALRLGLFDVFERMMRRAIASNPKLAGPYNNLGYELADRNLRLQEAKRLIQKAQELAPGNYLVLGSMGWVEFRLGHREEALELLRQSNERGPGRPGALAHLGEALWSLGRRDEAVAAWKSGIAKDPKNAMLLETVKRLGASL